MSSISKGALLGSLSGIAVSRGAPSVAFVRDTGAVTPPGDIADLSATAQSSTQVLLEWTPATGATNHQYRIDNGDWVACDDNSGAQLVTGLTASTQYDFQVRGRNGITPGNASNVASATTQAGSSFAITTPTVSTAESLSGDTRPTYSINFVDPQPTGGGIGDTLEGRWGTSLVAMQAMTPASVVIDEGIFIDGDDPFPALGAFSEAQVIDTTVYFQFRVIRGADESDWSTPAEFTLYVPPVTKLVAEGDSITAWAGSYSDLWAAANPGVPYANRAVGGSGITTMQDRLATVMSEEDPSHLTILIGANDLHEATSAADYVADLFTYVAAAKAIKPSLQVGICGILPIDEDAPANSPPNKAGFNIRRKEVNALLRAAVGNEIEFYIPLGEHPLLNDAAAEDPTLSNDGIHWAGSSGNAYAYMAEPYGAVMDSLVNRELGYDPAAFSFTDVSGATTSTRYEARVLITGLSPSRSVEASHTGDGDLARGQDAFGAGPVDVRAGDFVTLGVTSGASTGLIEEGTLTVGTQSDTFSVSTAGVPVLSGASDAASGADGATLAVTTDEDNGTLYWVVTNSSTAPSKAQVKAGQDHIGAAAADAGSQAVSAAGVQNAVASGLQNAIDYWAHFMHEDADTNQSNVVSGDGFTAGAVFDPLTTFDHWWNAADTGTLTGSPGVTQVADQIDTWHLTSDAGNAPTTGTMTLNGKNVLSFDGTEKIWHPAAAGRPISDTFDIFLLMHLPNTDGPHLFNISEYSDGTPNLGIQNAAGGLIRLAGAAAGFTGVSVARPAEGWHLFRVQAVDNTSLRWWIDGVEQTAPGGTYTGFGGVNMSLVIAASNGGGAEMATRWACTAFRNGGTMTSQEVSDFHDFLNTEYGLALP